MIKARGKRPGWKFTFTRKSLYFISKWFGRKGFCVDVFFNSTKAFDYDYSQKNADMPKWDKTTSKEFIEAETLRKRARGLKYQMPFLFWLIFVFQIVCIGLLLLMASKVGF